MDLGVRISDNDSFQDWALFLPPGLSSQWVCLKTFNWNFYGYASLSGSSLVLGPYTNPSTPTAQNSATQPTWSHVVNAQNPNYVNE
jgi:hypothetical protein